MTVFMGLNGIKSIINPVKDSINTSYVYKAVSIIPGIGDAASMLSQTVIASSLIKNTIGAAGVIALVLCMSFPVIACCNILYISGCGSGYGTGSRQAYHKGSTGTHVCGRLPYIPCHNIVSTFILTIVIVCIATGR